VSQVAHAAASMLSLTNFLLGFVRRQSMRVDRCGIASLAKHKNKYDCEKKADASGTFP
jgi:hypothetical protein